MSSIDFSELIARQAEEYSRWNHELVAVLVSRGQKFESWLQLEIFKSLLKTHPFLEIEKSVPNSKERCDFWINSPQGRWLVRVKLCVTNYCANLRKMLHRAPNERNRSGNTRH